MYPIGQILNIGDWKEFPNGRTEHIYALVHVLDAPKLMRMTTVS